MCVSFVQGMILKEVPDPYYGVRKRFGFTGLMDACEGLLDHLTGALVVPKVRHVTKAVIRVLWNNSQ
jgi:hypothetical protein